MKLICIGDSVTFGYGVRHSKRWTSLVDQLPDVDVRNYGLNGDTCIGMLSRFNAMERPRPGDFIFVMGGSNDIFFCGNCDTAKTGIASLIHQIVSTGATPIVGIPMIIGTKFLPEEWSRAVDFDGARKLISEYRQWLVQFCEAFKIEYIDFQQGFEDRFYIDGLHPNEEGHAYMAERVLELLNNRR